MPAGVSGFISLHFAASPQNFTFAERQILHISRQRDTSLKRFRSSAMPCGMADCFRSVAKEGEM